MAQNRYWYLHTSNDYAAMHGSPYSYDTHVPVFFAGNGLPAQRITRPVDPGNIAPTLLNRLGIEPPAGLAGQVLEEVTATTVTLDR